MLPKILGLIVFAMLTLPVSAQAERNPLLSETFEMGFNKSFHRYEEPGYMKIKGEQLGFDLAANWYDPMMKYRIRGELEYTVANFTYYGAIQSGSSIIPLTTDGDETYRNIRVTLGFVQPNGGNQLLTPYVGLAQRYLDNHIHNASAYRREITYFYAPVGVEGATMLSHDLRLRGSAEYDLFLGGSAKSHLQDINPANPEVTNVQTSGFGLRVAGAVDKSFGGFSLSLQPYFQFWKIDDSQSSYGFHEPPNDTVTYGLILSLLI